MKTKKTERGFHVIEHQLYTAPGLYSRLLQESSAIGNYKDKDSFDNPGSSFLWIGQEHHLNREEISKVISILQRWLNTGRLPLDVDAI